MTSTASFRSAAARTMLEAAFPDADAVLVGEVSRFLESQMKGLPSHLRIGVGAIEQVLVATSTARLRQPLWTAHREERSREVLGWEQSRLSPVRQYFRLIRSLTLFCAYEFKLGEDASQAWTRGRIDRIPV